MAIVKEVKVLGVFANAATTMSKVISCFLFGVAAFVKVPIGKGIKYVNM